MGNEGLTIDDVKQIQADAKRAVTRQFREAAEDHGWKPTEWQPKENITEMAEVPVVKPQAFTEDGRPAEAEAKQPAEAKPQDDGPSIEELRARAKELNLSAGGSKQALHERIAEAEAKTEDTKTDKEEGGEQ
jgi:hypothetical protein